MSVRDRLLVSAHALIETEGWAAVRMARVAESAGVSRQTVYNEFGTKHGLAEQLALRELARFLALVRDRMAGADDVVSGIRSACEGALQLGEESIIVRSVTGAGGDDDFLTILTTESAEIVETATAAVQQAVNEFYPPTGLTPEQLAVCVEAVVRWVLSAMTRPSKRPDETAADIGWLLGLALRGASI